MQTQTRLRVPTHDQQQDQQDQQDGGSSSASRTDGSGRGRSIARGTPSPRAVVRAPAVQSSSNGGTRAYAPGTFRLLTSAVQPDGNKGRDEVITSTASVVLLVDQSELRPFSLPDGDGHASADAGAGASNVSSVVPAEVGTAAAPSSVTAERAAAEGGASLSAATAAAAASPLILRQSHSDCEDRAEEGKAKEGEGAPGDEQSRLLALDLLAASGLSPTTIDRLKRTLSNQDLMLQAGRLLCRSEYAAKSRILLPYHIFHNRAIPMYSMQSESQGDKGNKNSH